MSSLTPNPHTPPDTPHRDTRTAGNPTSANPPSTAPTVSKRQSRRPRPASGNTADRSNKTTYFNMDKDIDHGSASAFAYTPTQQQALNTSHPPPPQRLRDTTTEPTCTTAFKIHTIPESSVLLVDGRICIDVKFEFRTEGLVDREYMVERQALIEREIRVRALEVLEKVVREEEVEDGRSEE